MIDPWNFDRPARISAARNGVSSSLMAKVQRAWGVGHLLAQSGRFASEPEAVALDCALRFESPPNSRPSMVCLCRASCFCRLLSSCRCCRSSRRLRRLINGRRHAGTATASCRAIISHRITAFQLTPRKLRFRAWRASNRRPWYIDPTPSYYGYDGDWHYFGRPGFYGGRYNGGSFGPCWTRTPIGPIWNCG